MENATYDRLQRIANDYHTLGYSLQALTYEAARTAAAESTADRWVKEWGECVNRRTAAKMLGVSATTITRMVADGKLTANPAGNVIVRTAAEWANSPSAPPRIQRRAGVQR